MKIPKTFSAFLEDITHASELQCLERENRELRDKERDAIGYIRRKVNQLLMVMGTLPLKQEELDDRTLLELDPIGIVADSFGQVLDHLNRTNEKLKHAHSEIQAIFTAAGVGMLVVDREMKVQMVNQKLRELFLNGDEDVRGRGCSEIVCKQRHIPIDCICEKVLCHHVACRIPDVQLGNRHFEVHGAPVRDRYGDITHIVISYHEVTDHVRLEAALRERGAVYHGLFENVSDMVVGLTGKGTVFFTNRSWRETCGYPSEEANGMPFAEMIHPYCREDWQTAVRKAMNGVADVGVALTLVAKSGVIFPVEGAICCVSLDGMPSHVYGTFRRRPGTLDA